MKTFWKRLICLFRGHEWLDNSNLIDDHTIHMNWKCKRCGKIEWKIVDVDNCDKE